jgi:hypothetical protein
VLTDEAILAAIDAGESTAIGPLTSEVASDRADALDRYLGKPYGDEQQGRSQVVSRDVADVVEGVTANVLKPFVSGDEIVKFDPRGPEDEQQAEQETDYINFVALERNNGFLTLTSFVKDALLLRNGYIKCGWRKREDVVVETYVGLSDDELNALAQDEDVEITGHNEYPSINPMETGQTLHDVTVRRKQATEYVETQPAPPDEIMVSQRTTEPSLQNADFVQHRVHKTLSELREAGYKVDDDLTDDDDSNQTLESYARQNYGIPGEMWDDPTMDPSRRLVLFKETWMRLDVDEDGIAELRRICSVGHTILANEEATIVPIASAAAVIMPHRHLGVSIYDLVKDLAQIKTALTRGTLDNLYLTNNAEKIVNVDAIVSIDDFMASRPGGIKRVSGDPNAAVVPLTTPFIGAGALQTLEYMDSVREERTGYTRAAQGLDAEALRNSTATGVMQAQSQAQLRLEMIARTIAETGLRDLFRIIHALTLQHSTRAEKVRLRNKWVMVNPREWVRRTDLSISVGLGSNSGQQQIQNLMLIGQAQQTAMPLGIVQPQNVYNTLRKLANAAGFKNPDEFFTPPQPGQQPPSKPDPLVQAAQIKAQSDQQQHAMDLQADAQKFQAEQQAKQQQIAMDAEAKRQDQQNSLVLQQSNDQRQAQLDQLSHEREIQRMMLEDKFKRDQMAQEFAFKQWDAEQNRANQLRIAQMKPRVPPSQGNVQP